MRTVMRYIRALLKYIFIGPSIFFLSEQHGFTNQQHGFRDIRLKPFLSLKTLGLKILFLKEIRLLFSKISIKATAEILCL